MLRWWRLGQHPDHLPVVAGHGLRNDPSTFAVGGGEAGDEQGVAEGRETVCSHEGRIRNVDRRARVHSILREELGELRQEGRIEGLVRRIAILGLAPNRYRTVYAQGGEDALLEVRSLILAIAIGHLKGQVLGLGKLVLAPDTARGRIKMDVATLQATPHGRPDRTGREEPHGTKVVEASEDTPRGIVVQGLWGHGLASEQCGVLLGEELFQAVQRTAATERIQ